MLLDKRQLRGVTELRSAITLPRIVPDTEFVRMFGFVRPDVRTPGRFTERGRKMAKFDLEPEWTGVFMVGQIAVWT